MRKIDSYLAEYQESHQNPLNIKIHNICVPAIMWSILVFLSTVVIGPFAVSWILMTFALIYYGAIARVRTVLGIGLIGALMIMSTLVLPAPRIVAIAVFAAAWVGQFYGHKVEGKKPSFFKDLLFLLIGPVWVLKKFAPALV